jgi:hypothetical protein
MFLQLLSIASDVFITEWAKETDYEQQRHIDRNIAIYSALACMLPCGGTIGKFYHGVQHSLSSLCGYLYIS